jgi:tetratricopeptide (TPR) repeat protein
MTRWGGSHEMMQQFFEECRQAKLSAEHMRLLESVVAEDQGWIYQFVDHNYPAAEAAYRQSAALGGDKQLKNLADVLALQHKYAEEIEPLTERLAETPNDLDVLANRSLAYMQSGKPAEGLRDLTAAAEAGSPYCAERARSPIHDWHSGHSHTRSCQAGVSMVSASRPPRAFRRAKQNLDKARAALSRR